jgi:hypothetical protein
MYVREKTFIEILGEKFTREDSRWELYVWMIG